MNDGPWLSLAKQMILSVQISTWKPKKRKHKSLNKANTSLCGKAVVWRERAGRTIQHSVLCKKKSLD